MVVAVARPTIDQQIRSLPSDALYEIVNGEVVEVAPMGMLAGSLANYLAMYINLFAHPARLGMAFVEVLYRFRDDLPQRRPDLSFVSAKQWPGVLTGDNDPPSLAVVPELAAEVVSPNNTSAEIEEKRLEYFEAGVKVVWVIYPLQRTIHVYEAMDQCRVLSIGDTLDGVAAIPGFRLDIRELFASLVPPAKEMNGKH